MFTKLFFRNKLCLDENFTKIDKNRSIVKRKSISIIGEIGGGQQ